MAALCDTAHMREQYPQFPGNRAHRIALVIGFVVFSVALIVELVR
jgi:hypothetical protein